MQGRLNLVSKKERPYQHHASSSSGPLVADGVASLNPLQSTPLVDVKVWQDRSTPPRARWSISQTPTQPSQATEQQIGKRAVDTSVAKSKRRREGSPEDEEDDNDEIMDLPLSQWVARKVRKTARNVEFFTSSPPARKLSVQKATNTKGQGEAIDYVAKTQKLSQLSHATSQQKSRKVDKVLLQAIDADQIDLTPLELQVTNIVWKLRPVSGLSPKALSTQQRGGWTKRAFIIHELHSIESELVERTIEGLVQRGILESTEDRGKLGASKLRPLAQRLLEQLQMGSLKRIYKLDPESHPPKYGPRRKAVYIASIRNCIIGRATERSPVSQNPSLVKKKYVQKLCFGGMEVWERVANAIVNEAGSCVRMVKNISERIEHLHARLESEAND